MIDMDRIRDASFRGVAFHCQTSDRRTAKRVSIKRYPYQDRQSVQDLGLSEGRFALDIFVIGAQAYDRRLRLREALGQTGPGLLVHPTQGEISVQVLDWSERESFAELGVVDFKVNFVISDDQRRPHALVDTQATVLSAADLAQQAATARFEESFLTLSSEEQQRLPRLLDKLGRIFRTGAGTLDDLTPSSLADSLAREIRRETGPAGFGLAGESKSLGLAVFRFVERVTAAQDSPLAAASLFLSALSPEAGDLFAFARGAFTSGRAANANNGRKRATGSFASLLQEVERSSDGSVSLSSGRQGSGQGSSGDQSLAAQSLLQASSIAAARSAARSDFETLQQAIQTRDAITAALRSSLLEGAGSAERVQNRNALRDLSVALHRDLSERAAELPSLREHRPQATQTARVLAYRLTGSLADQKQMIRRNAVHHPSFVPADQPLLFKRPAKEQAISVRGALGDLQGGDF